jgi:hypothetical protein
LSKSGGTTNAKGQLSFKYAASDLGRAGVHAKVTAPSSTTGELFNASAGRQRLLTNGHSESASGGTHFRIAAAKARMKNSCTTDCDGVAKVTFVGKAKKGSGPMRIRFYVDDKIVGHCDTKSAKKKARTCSIVKHEADASYWTGYDSCALKNGKCVSHYTFTKVHEQIVCPPGPSFQFVIKTDCNCQGTLVPSPGGPAGSARVYTAWELVDGKMVGSTVTLKNGDYTALPTFNVKSGHTYEVRVKTRAGGHTYTWTKNALHPFDPAVRTVS